MKLGQTVRYKYGYKTLALGFWLFVWEGLSRWVNQEILLSSPLEVLKTLILLGQSSTFWRTIMYSSGRILYGFILAIVTGILFAVLSYKSRLIDELISPFMKVLKAIPVASFIILALLWINKTNLSILISYMMVMPMIYANVLQGLHSSEEKLLEMAKVFRVGRIKRIRAIYVPAVLPYFISAISVGMGFCWKAGIAAEVIGIPAGTIGRSLYEAKLYFMTKDLFAWSIVIILVSVLFEKAVMLIIKLVYPEGKVNILGSLKGTKDNGR